MQAGDNTSSGYSIIAAVMMIGFLIVFCSGTLQLVLSEMQDGRGRQEYIKASAAAEGALELALLKVKENGYGFSETKNDIDTLGALDDRKTAVMNYEFASKVQIYSDSIGKSETIMIPLFWIDELGVVQNLSGPGLSFSAPGEILWNIIGDGVGISGNGNFTSSITRTRENVDGSSTPTTVKDFVSGSPSPYLQIYNSGAGVINFSLETSVSDEYFTLPKATIYSTARIGKYSQNLKTELNNTDFLNILRYSIFSN